MILLLLACANSVAWSPQEIQRLQSLSPIPPPPANPSNAVADRADAAELGKQIFYDPGFSADNQVACATCHIPERHFTDGQTTATTARGTGNRNVPTVEGAAWNTWFFWDGRADSAWAQATGPFLNPIEHATTPADIRQRVLSHYQAPYEAIFGAISEDPLQVTANIGKSIEAFERTLKPAPGRFDRYIAALPQDTDILSPQEKEGLHLFIGRAGCINCHNGPLLMDRSFHNLGLPQNPRFGLDLGRARGATEVLQSPFNCQSAYSDTQDCPELKYLDPSFPDWPSAFKTPSLRNVAQTAPYMHDGSMADLQAVLSFYAIMPGQPIVGHREITLEALHLSNEQIAAITAFLGTLTSE